MRRRRELRFGLGGEDDGRPTVYLHGAVLGSSMWHAQRDAVSGQRQVFVDLPGAGDSRDVAWRSMADSARLVLDVVDSVSPVEPVDLVGISLGGDLGVRIVTVAPQRIRSAVLSGMISRPQRPWGEVRTAWRDVPRLRDPRLLSFFAEHNGLPEVEVTRLLRHGETMRRRDYARTLLSVYRGMDLDALRHVRTPVLALCGETEHLVAHDAVRDLVRSGPSVTGALTRGLGHSLNSENPGRFADILTDWFGHGRLATGLEQMR